MSRMMAQHGLGVAGLALLLVTTTLCPSCSAQAATVTMPTCAPVPISLSPCIGYVLGVGSGTLSSCCSQLQAFFESQGPCLCAMTKLVPSSFGLVLGQAQAMIPNVCNLPSNPCDDSAAASSAPDDSTPDAANTTEAYAPATPPAAPEATKSTTPASPDASEAPPAPADDPPSSVAQPGQAAPEGAGSHVASSLPELLHSAGGRSSWDTAAGTALITLFLAYVPAMRV